MKKKIFFALLAIANAAPDGFTVDARTLQPVTSGYAVAVIKATQNSFNAEGLECVINYVLSNEQCNAFGGWLDVETGLYYWDGTVILPNLDDAYQLAKENDDYDYEVSIELPEQLKKKATEFTEWYFPFMPRDEDNNIAWGALAEGELSVEVLHDGAWRPVCDWDEALNHYLYNGTLPRVKK